MRNLRRALLAVAWLCLPVLCIAQGEKDVEGSKDHPLLNRMPGFYIGRYDDKEFDSHTFLDGKKQEIKAEGHLTSILYNIQSGTKEPSRLQILRNYENAVKKIGGIVLLSDSDGSSFIKLEKDGKEIWIHVDAYITSQYSLYILEKEGMVQQVTANAAAFSNDIKTTGHAAVYGIYFDTGKSEIKAESEPALAEVAKLLQGNAALKVHVVGHTDNVGDFAINMKLSQARADAVVQALAAKYGISGARMKSSGVASLAPVESNDTEPGRAKNRRVELVKQ
jgi:outer membrane protein OmpA-like peptidoglycan-associated protein